MRPLGIWNEWISENDTDSATEEAEKITNHLDAKQSSAPLFKQALLSASRASILKHLLLEDAILKC